MSTVDDPSLAPLLSQVLRHPAALGPRAALCGLLEARGVPAAASAWLSTTRLAAGRGQFSVALALTLRKLSGAAQATALRELSERYGGQRWKVGNRLPPPMPGARTLSIPDDADAQVGLALRLLGDLSGLTLPDDALMPDIPLFGALAPGAFSALARTLSESNYKPGEALIRQGTLDRTVFLLAQGKARVEVQKPDGAVSELAVVLAPALVGEMAVLTAVPRRASVVAVEPVLAWRLGAEGLDRLSALEPDLRTQLDTLVKRRLLANVLRTSKLLGPGGAPEAAIQAFQIRPVTAGESIFEQGVPSPGLFVVLHGQAEVWTRDDSGDRVRVATLTEGDAFGEFSLLTGAPTTAAVHMPEGGVLLHLSAEAFARLRPQLGSMESELAELMEVRRGELDDLIGTGEGASDFELVDEAWLVGE